MKGTKNSFLSTHNNLSFIHVKSPLSFPLTRLMLLIASLATISLSSCVRTTRFQNSGFCSADLLSNDSILIPYIPTENPSFTLRLIKKKLKNREVTGQYILEEEYNFRSSGVLNPLDSQYYDKVIQKGFKYFLMIDVLDSKSAGNFYSYYTPYEISQQNNPYSYEHEINRNYDRSSTATIKLELFSLAQNQTVYRLIARTSISPVTRKDSEGGETSINLSDREMAINIAISKGVKRILKKCK